MALDRGSILEPAFELAQFPFSISGVAVRVDEGAESMLFATLPGSFVNLLVSPVEFTVALLDFLDVLTDVLLAVGPDVGSLAVDSTVGPATFVALAVFPDHLSLAIISAVGKVANITIAVGLSVGSLTMSEVLLEAAGVLVTVLGDFTALAILDSVSPVAFIDVFVDDADFAGAGTLVPETLEEAAVAGHQFTISVLETVFILSLVSVAVGLFVWAERRQTSVFWKVTGLTVVRSGSLLSGTDVGSQRVHLCHQCCIGWGVFVAESHICSLWFGRVVSNCWFADNTWLGICIGVLA